MAANARTARGLLFASVAGVLALAAERPARGSAEILPEQVLTTVPARNSEQGRRIAQLERDPDAKLELARTYLEAARRDADPRYLGAAEGVLVGMTSLDARVLHATILQSRHEFPAALAELESVLREREHAQARLTHATVLGVLAEYSRARESCAALPASTYAVACTASVDALTGEPERARAALEQALRHAGSERAWLLSLLGELAYWQGDDTSAERLLRTSLALEQDRYSRALLADLQLDRGQHEDVGSDDLHASLGELTRGAPGEAVARFEASIADSAARGDRVHLREEARFWLARGQRERALALARENWRVQREPWDARVWLEAARTRAEAAPVLAWLEHTRVPRLQALAARLETP
jgi:tetratricopeptide (TPR) repeat protein